MKQYHIGLCHVQMGKPEEALQAYRSIREVDTNTLGVNSNQFLYGLYINMGSVLQFLARRKKNPAMFEEAKACYEYALQLDDHDAKVWNNLGNIFLDLEKYEDAERCFKKAIGLDDEFPEAHYCLSLVYEFTQQIPNAIEQLENALHFKNSDKNILNRLSAFCLASGHYEKAKSYAKRAVDVDPNNLSALTNLTLILYNLREYDEAYTTYQRILKIKPDFKDKEVSSIFDDLKEKVSK
jgi:tetratricopeptide (TPR) repeat protein